MENKIGAGKRLTEVYALVEYTFEFDTYGFGDCSCDDDEPHTEYEKCYNLRDLMKAMSIEKIEELKQSTEAKKVFITSVVMQGKNNEGDSSHITFNNREVRGYTRAKIDESNINSKMNDCVKEIEKQLLEVQSTIKRYRI